MEGFENFLQENQIYCKYWLFFVGNGSELLAKSDGEPVEDLNDGDEADSKAKSADAAKAGDEVQPSHLWRPFEFWNKKVPVEMWNIETDQTPLIFQRKCSRWRCPFHMRCSTHPPDKQRLIRSYLWFKSKTLAREDMSSLSPMEFGYLFLIGPDIWLV